jgi:hypothetical protein
VAGEISVLITLRVMIFLSRSERSPLIRSALLGGEWRRLWGGNHWVRRSSWYGSRDDWSACRWIGRRVGRWYGRIGRGWTGRRTQDDRGSWCRHSGRSRRGKPGAFDFIDWNLVIAGPAADNFGTDIVQRIRVVLNRLCALVCGGARMSKALAK